MLPVEEVVVVAAVVEPTLDADGNVIPVESTDTTVEVNYWPFIWGAPGVMIMSIGVYVLYAKVFAKNTPNARSLRLNTGHSDLRNVSAKELEALSLEERQILKKLLLENIRADTNGLI